MQAVRSRLASHLPAGLGQVEAGTALGQRRLPGSNDDAALSTFTPAAAPNQHPPPPPPPTPPSSQHHRYRSRTACSSHIIAYVEAPHGASTSGLLLTPLIPHHPAHSRATAPCDDQGHPSILP
ncbi:uncharacterized protein PSFLO_00505 [Pseudozyma flocculosa]|uniref:Uncharacterized protein n=1 Tax=Pseudozyma flocculosa TaxID=84751 RepID=A0A5C3ERV6_9BASI|nr:uncharacterized protein PSFLO_00505 [Pseudozyma flocculosa]